MLFLDDYFPSDISPIRTTKEKKIKRIKIINNYGDDSNTQTSSHTNGSITLTPTTTILRNEYDDTNAFSDDSNTINNCSLNISQRSDDSTSNNYFSTINNNENSSYFSTITSSTITTPSIVTSTQSKLSQKHSKTPIRTQIYRNSKGLTTKFSIQSSDDSVCSYEQSSFFATTIETDEEIEQRKLKALNTIDIHLAKTNVDPFNSELCKAFLTKMDFPQRESNDNYKLVNTPIPKLANTKTTYLADITYNIEKEVGRGSYGSVYKAVDTNSGAVVAIKYQRPPNVWEVYICNEVKKRIRNYNIVS